MNNILQLDRLYRLEKIAFHNSANMNFCCFDLTKNTHLQGSNGSGKSSILNTVQIGYLPYTSFDNIDKNYTFKSSKKFTKDETYNYYFPENNSYLIYEFRNPHGIFCQIIAKDGQQQFRRMFVSATYEEILPWFWTFENEDDILGKPTKINLFDLEQKVKSKQGKILNKKKDIENIIYKEYDINKDNCIFSVFHTNIEENKSKIINIIMRLSNDASMITNDILKSVMCEIMDTKGVNTDDKLDIDLLNIISELENLEIQGKDITLKKNLLNDKKRLDFCFNEFENNEKEIINLFFLISEYLDRTTNTIDNDLKINNGLLIDINTEINNHKNNIEEANNSLKSLENRIAVLNSHIEQHSKLEIEINNIMQKKNITNANDMLEQIKKQLNTNYDYLEDIKNSKNIEKRIKENKNKLKNNIDLKDNIIQQINNFNNLFLRTIPNNYSDILFTINNKFSSLINNENIKFKEDIINFCNLFTVNNNVLYLDNISLGHIKKYDFKTLEMLNIELDTINEEIYNIENIIKTDESKLKDSFSEHKEEELKKDINKLENIQQNTRLYLSGIDNYFKNKEEFDNKNNLHINLSNEIKLLQEHIKTAKENKANITENNKQLNNEKNQNDSYIEKFKIFTHGLQNEIKIPENYIPYNQHTNQSYHELKDLCNKNSLFLNEISTIIKNFINNEIIQDDKKISIKSNLNILDIKEELYNPLYRIYTDLNNEEELWKTNVKNNVVLISDRITNISNYIKQYNMIFNIYNKNLEKVKLSSINNFKIKPEYEPSILNLIKEFEDIGRLRNDGIEIFFEEKLTEKFKNIISILNIKKENGYKINANNLIKSIEIEYQDQYGKYITTAPSTGTNVVISTILLSMIIKDFGGDFDISIPINLDETGQIDNKNLKELITFINNNNLTLFSASPQLMMTNCGFQKSIKIDKYYNKDVKIGNFPRTIHLHFGDNI